jgi:Phosphotransferase enzyme family
LLGGLLDRNQFSDVAGGAYDPSVVPAWREVQLLVTRELGEPVSGSGPLVPARRSGMTWAARAQRAGAIVVKVRHGDRAYEKTQWCAAHLPALGARGYPVPAILWHGMISAQWHVTVQNRIPGRPLLALGVALDGPLRARLRHWLEPVRGLRLPAADYAHNDLDLSNVLTDGARITGVVDWDEFGLGSRALDLVALAVDCEERGDSAAADRLLARAAQVAGDDGLRCLVSYRIIGGLAVFTHERQAYGNSLGDRECAAGSAILDRLQATGSA